LSSPLAPSDVWAAPPVTGAQLRIAGRILQVTENEALLADALANLRVCFAEPSTVRLLAEGCLLEVSGSWSGRELQAASLERLWPAPTPSGKGDVQRFLFSGVGRNLAARSQILQLLRGYFLERGFVEVETPLRVPAPGVDANVDALSADQGYLITSPELEMKRLLVGGLPRHFQLARVTRREELGSLHEPEFTLLEWYRAFADMAEVQADTEQLVRRVALAVRGKSELIAPDGRAISVESPFARVRVADAFREFADVADVVDLAASDEARYFELLVSLVEPALARLPHAVFLEAYPLSQAALARPSPGDPNFAERFELYVGGVELCNGYGELTDPAEQRRRMQAERDARASAGRSVYPLSERFLSALSEGMPQAGGNALGVDRLVVLALGAASIQDVIAFPRASL